MNVWQTLQMAREAWDIGRPLESWRLMDECQPDFEYARCADRRTVDDVRYQVTDVERAMHIRRVNWLEWQTPATEWRGADAYEIRIRSYATTIQHTPGFHYFEGV